MTWTPWFGASVPVAAQVIAVADVVAVVVAISCVSSPNYDEKYNISKNIRREVEERVMPHIEIRMLISLLCQRVRLPTPAKQMHRNYGLTLVSKHFTCYRVVKVTITKKDQWMEYVGGRIGKKLNTYLVEVLCEYLNMTISKINSPDFRTNSLLTNKMILHCMRGRGYMKLC